MIKLINKGGFRERANRSQRYHQSENQIASLEKRAYKSNHTLLSEEMKPSTEKCSSHSQSETSTAIESITTITESTATTELQQSQ